MCGAAAVGPVGGEVVEGAEEGAKCCTSRGYKSQAGFDGGPDRDASVLLS